MSNVQFSHVDFNAPRTELHDLLNLTGAEVSINRLPAGVSVPFVHAHTENEELYVVLDGSGVVFVDGVEKAITKGDCFCIAPEGQRCLKASEQSPLTYLCLQTKVGSLSHFTMTDAVVREDFTKPSWL